MSHTRTLTLSHTDAEMAGREGDEQEVEGDEGDEEEEEIDDEGGSEEEYDEDGEGDEEGAAGDELLMADAGAPGGGRGAHRTLRMWGGGGDLFGAEPAGGIGTSLDAMMPTLTQLLGEAATMFGRQPGRRLRCVGYRGRASVGTVGVGHDERYGVTQFLQHVAANAGAQVALSLSHSQRMTFLSACALV